MSRINTLKAERAKKHQAIGELRKTAESRAMTKEERDQVTAHEAAIVALDDDIAAENRFLDRERNWNGPADADQEAARKAAEVAGQGKPVVKVGQDRTELDPMAGFRSPREFLMAVIECGMSRQAKLDRRLLPLRAPALATAGSDEQGAYSSPYGDFLVPAGMAPNILQLRPEDDPVESLVTPFPMTAPSVMINARVDKDHSTSVSGGITVTRRPETVSGSSSRMQFEQVTLTANENFGLAYATERILSDSPISFAAILAAGFRDQFGWARMKERLRGTGAGEPLGVLNSGCLISVSKETGQKAATILTENVDKMVARSWRYGSAIWLANNTTFPQLQGLVRNVGTGGAPVQYLQWAPGGQMYLVGRPLFMTEHCSALGTVGDLILCVWTEYLYGLYQALQQAESVHVRFEAHERAFKFWLRDDGQPWWRTALTPTNGDTLSPWVALATRA